MLARMLDGSGRREDVGFGSVHGPELALAVRIAEQGHPERYSLGESARTLGLPEHPSRDWVVQGDDGVRTAAGRVSAVLERLRGLVAGDSDLWATLRRR